LSPKEMVAVREACKLGIPVVGIVDTNCDPEEVDHVIPGNDDALRAIRLFTSKIADACLEGRGLTDRNHNDGAAVEEATEPEYSMTEFGPVATLPLLGEDPAGSLFDSGKREVVEATEYTAMFSMMEESSRSDSSEEDDAPTGGEDDPAVFLIRAHPDISPAEFAQVLGRLADFYRACGGAGFKIDFELQHALVEEPEDVLV
jgi:hypothetical protein